MHAHGNLLVVHLDAAALVVDLLARLARVPLLDAPAEDGDDEHEALEKEDHKRGVEGEFL